MEKPLNKVGRPRKFKTPIELWEAFESFVNYQRENPIPKTHYVGKDGDLKIEFIPRPLTYLGFEGYLAKFDLLKDLKNYERIEEFIPIIARIRAFCKAHNTDMALVGEYKENLVARIEGIKEQTETDSRHTISEVKIEVKRSE